METRIIDPINQALPLSHLTHEARTLINDVVKDGKRKARRAVKRAYVAAEDRVVDTTYFIKRHPWQSMGIAAGFGLGAGILASLIFSCGARAATKDLESEFRAVER